MLKAARLRVYASFDYGFSPYPAPGYRKAGAPETYRAFANNLSALGKHVLVLHNFRKTFLVSGFPP